ncbi:MAG: hypothetical protein A2583_06845 [Bdellovibrionales bacterium RIFOXYD1_FULL_53_11]|nr:MAG: hypothetical protein A2583_06845 [Bdellovibrionales bacterium RIFOXYD1_FULL_53_11]
MPSCSWIDTFDRIVPCVVKTRLGKNQSWGQKPFGEKDFPFFFRGIKDLSEFFTDLGPKQLPSYFSHPRYRSSYLLYFMQLHASRFSCVFDRHPDALKLLLTENRLRILDLGAGPGTASLALLLWLSQNIPHDRLDGHSIAFDWYDTNAAIMEDGSAIFDEFCKLDPFSKMKITVNRYRKPWQYASGDASLVLAGNVLNEDSRDATKRISDILSASRPPGGVLLLEPALRNISRGLARIREELVSHPRDPAKPGIRGPCLHHGQCPLGDGRDWCHFSVLHKVPGRIFARYSQMLGSERLRAKFCYLWLSSPGYPAPAPDANSRLIISDNLARQQGRAPRARTDKGLFLVCESGKTQKIQFTTSGGAGRGTIIKTH